MLLVVVSESLSGSYWTGVVNSKADLATFLRTEAGLDHYHQSVVEKTINEVVGPQRVCFTIETGTVIVLPLNVEAEAKVETKDKKTMVTAIAKVDVRGDAKTYPGITKMDTPLELQPLLEKAAKERAAKMIPRVQLNTIALKLGLESDWDLDFGLAGTIGPKQLDLHFGAAELTDIGETFDPAEAQEMPVTFYLKDGEIRLEGERWDGATILVRPNLSILTKTEQMMLRDLLADEDLLLDDQEPPSTDALS